MDAGGSLAIVVVFWIIIWGGIGAAIASSKGINGGTGFLLGALLGLIGNHHRPGDEARETHVPAGRSAEHDP